MPKKKREDDVYSFEEKSEKIVKKNVSVFVKGLNLEFDSVKDFRSFLIEANRELKKLQ